VNALTVVAESIAAMPDDESLEALVAQMNHTQLKAFLAGAEQIRKLATSAVKMAESRVVGEQVLAVGEMVEFNGREYFWGSDRRGEVADPLGFKVALYELLPEMDTLAKRALLAAFKDQGPKVYLTEIARLKKYGPKSAGVIVEDFVTYKDTPPHLKPVSPEAEV
jgi:hypothetical protein